MNRVQIQIIKDALDQAHALTDWEHGFINSIAELEEEAILSEKQNSILNRIGSKLE